MSSPNGPSVLSLVQPVENVGSQIPRAFVVSCLAAALDLGMLVGLVEFVGLQPLLAATISYLTGGVLQYFLCCVWVFSTIPDNVLLGFVYFSILSLVGLAITWATIWLLFDLAQINYIAAKILALGLSFAWNFLSRKFLIFERR